MNDEKNVTAAQPMQMDRMAAPSDGGPNVGYERLRSFLTQGMSMSHVYQPIMVKTVLMGGGAATRRQIAAAFLAADLSQLEYYEEIVKRDPTKTLRKHATCIISVVFIALRTS